MVMPSAAVTGSAAATPDVMAVSRIKAGDVNCRGCNLAGADLAHTCVKNGDLTGAGLDGAKATYMCISFANLSNVSFRNADLSGANMGHAKLTAADFTGATIDIVNLKGADLSTARGLTQAQLDTACSDATTRLPAGLTAKPFS